MTHPVFVHVPIALVLLWPVVDLAGLWWRRREVSFVALALLVLAILSSIAATATGQVAFDQAVRDHHSIDLLLTHADKANPMPWVLIAVLGMRLWGAQKLGYIGHGLGLILGMALWPWMYLVGQSGGALVYEHGVGVRAQALNVETSK